MGVSRRNSAPEIAAAANGTARAHACTSPPLAAIPEVFATTFTCPKSPPSLSATISHRTVAMCTSLFLLDSGVFL